MKKLTFDQVKSRLCYGLRLQRGVPDARYPSYKYKYTLYYVQNNAIYDVCKTLEEVLQSSEECNLKIF